MHRELRGLRLAQVGVGMQVSCILSSKSKPTSKSDISVIRGNPV